LLVVIIDCVTGFRILKVKL